MTRRADKHLLLELSRQLEVQAGELGPEAVLLAAFQHARFFTPRTAQRYQALAERLALVAAIGADMPPEPAPD
ncbi:MAG: DICT sensory domain-containing protein [Solirubrobacteraceae bacterium]